MKTPKEQNANRAKPALLSLFFLLALSGKSQAPTDPFTVYNYSLCDIRVAIEYWDDQCQLGTPCYNSPIGGDLITASNSFLVPGCGALTPGDIHVVVIEIDGVPVTSQPNDVGHTDPCITSSGVSITWPYPAGAACPGSWTMSYNGPSNVTFQKILLP